MMRCLVQKKTYLVILSPLLLFALLRYWTRRATTTVDVGPGQSYKAQNVLKERLQNVQNSYDNIPYVLKESVAGRLALNVCVCEADKKPAIDLPFAQVLFPRVWAQDDFHTAFQEAELAQVKSRRQQEYNSFQQRYQTPADLLVIAEANSPLQYPTQGVEVRPLKTIVIPGLGLKEKHRQLHTVNLTATLGTFDVLATVDGVSIRGQGVMHMTLSSRLLSTLNRQLQFVTYTNTLFHPRTADTVQFETDGHQSVFTIKVGHAVIPKLYHSGYTGEYNISSLVTIATKTFLRYDKLQDLIDSIREFYPTVTIVIADDNEHPQPVMGPYIEHYIMPFGKGWFAGRNLAVSQVTTKYVLWVDDDFLFTSNTRLEKMVEILEKTTLDMVGGAVREATGYTATYRHTISVEEGGEEGDCIHIRNGYHHVIEGFPNCVLADAVINFFMGRTDKMQQVGFDPRLNRVAHLEFFIDGLGNLHIASCDDIIINHASKIKLPWGKSHSEKAYAKFRYSSSDAVQIKNALFYFKNRLKCMSSN
ncbi:beta-1,4 N-acetylgalactosaminyltransferase 1 [Oncorhynchus mykiss]|uniref:Beta-1,4 N-acetylgalactosaminyltransferase n=2 Tax=Oncorhynchus mykiss TaxID=8022 RepID=A0A8C7Q075_ONCMY|nr:beta-1,4 N-acetylgalactosaminyltransferase 1 [Oncorhynchus mykiss]XP_021472463.2 beta-1,4 N-acetylgalactosaminyltransferase 1 [Oncorhynchus mykiss]